MSREPIRAVKGTRDILTAGSRRFIPANVYDRSALAIGTEIRGPAIVEQPDTTVVIDPGATAIVDHLGNLVISVGAA